MGEWQTVELGANVFTHQALSRGADGKVYLCIRTVTGEFIADVDVDALYHDSNIPE